MCNSKFDSTILQKSYREEKRRWSVVLHRETSHGSRHNRPNNKWFAITIHIAIVQQWVCHDEQRKYFVQQKKLPRKSEPIYIYQQTTTSPPKAYTNPTSLGLTSFAIIANQENISNSAKTSTDSFPTGHVIRTWCDLLPPCVQMYYYE